MAMGMLIAAASTSAIANTTLDLYRLGEADPGATIGATTNAMTIDSGPDGNNLSRQGPITYSSNVAAPGSTISMAFNDNSAVYSGNVLTTAITNVGITAWVYPTAAAPSVSTGIAYNGNPGSSGYGLYQGGSDLGFTPPAGDATIIAIVGGVDFESPTVPSVNVPLNTWSEVTQIIQNGENELFLNGILVTEHADTPRTPSADFELGTGFVGNIDEVSVFTVPEPTSIGLVGLAGLGLLLRRRRARSQRYVSARPGALATY
jgi:hypothetical protein